MPVPPVPRQSAADRETHQILEVADRLCREFAPEGGLAAEAVRARVRAARAGFIEPMMLTYIPALVERTVRRQLIEAAQPHRIPRQPTAPPANRLPVVPTAAVPTARPAARRAPKLTVNTVLAGAGAAATSAVIGSLFGAAGTVAGAALGSVVLTLATAVYHRSLDHTRDTVKSHINLPSVHGMRLTVETEVPAPRDSPEADADPVQVAITATQPPGPTPHHRRRIVVMAGTTVLVFALGLGLATGIELLKGSTLTHDDQGTSVGQLITGDTTPRTPVDTPAPSAPTPAEAPEISTTQTPTTEPDAGPKKNRTSEPQPSSSHPSPTSVPQSTSPPASTPTSQPESAGASSPPLSVAPGTR